MAATDRHLLLHFTRNGALRTTDDSLLILERADGPYVFDTHGRRYLDGLSALYCCQIGYSYGSEIAQAISAQLEQMPFATVWGAAHPRALELSEGLSALFGSDLPHVFFTSGGSESVESAWKLARQFHVATGQPERTKAIARNNSYHGVTIGALALTGVPRFKEPFGSPAIPTRHVSNTNPFRQTMTEDQWCQHLLDEIEQVIEEEGPETIAMIIAEPVQNAGGCITPPRGYWPGLRELADRFGILLVADEVITAFGRVGEWLGSHRFAARPDIVTLAKGLTSAYAPMGAVLVSDRVAGPLYDDQVLLHGYTFAGHPVSAAVALKNIEILRRDRILENVRELEPHLQRSLNELKVLPIVGDVRGAGFFWAIELVNGEENDRLSEADQEQLIHSYLPKRLLEAGLIAKPDDRGDPVIHIAPPLICTEQVLDELVERLAEVLADAASLLTISKSVGATSNA